MNKEGNKSLLEKLRNASVSDLLSAMEEDSFDIPIIGIAGISGSGKDTLYRYLDSKTNKYLHHLKFSNSLKGVVSHLFGVNSDVLEGANTMNREFRDTPLTKFGGLTPRHILQRVGVSMRDIYEDVWVDKAMADLDLEAVNVFTDVRFDNEADAIQKRGGLLIYISRQNNTRGAGDWVEEEKKLDTEDQHVSETYVKYLANYTDLVVSQSEISEMKKELYGV